MNITARGIDITACLTEEDVKQIDFAPLEGKIIIKSLSSGRMPITKSVSYACDSSQVEPAKVTPIPLDWTTFVECEKVYISVNHQYLEKVILRGIAGAYLDDKELNYLATTFTSPYL